MKLAILFLAIAVLAAVDVSGDVFVLSNAPPPIVARNPRAKAATLLSMKMPVDHFNEDDHRTWSMRFYSNGQHFVKGGPMFIYLGGEWTIRPGDIEGGQIYDMAKQHGGCLFYTEHRYYGESWPTNDLTTPNLQYLTVHQALQDVVTFITEMKKIAQLADSKVVVVGGSYSATMATWLRAEYPHLIDAAYSSSAPLLALDDFKQYMEVLGANIQLEHQTCWDVIREGTAAMEELFQTEEGITQLDNLVNSCARPRADFPYKDFFFYLIGVRFAGVVQNAKPGSIYGMCHRIVNFSGSSLQKLSAYLREKDGCFHNYDDYLNMYSRTSLKSGNNRQWFYQTCNEFGFFQTGNSTEQPFGVNWFSSISHSLCRGAFGEEFTTERILNGFDQTNAYWGGLRPNITNVVSIHGSVDPWHAIGLLEDLNEDAPAILVRGSSHCADLASISPIDSPQMRKAKQTAKDLIAKWIS